MLKNIQALRALAALGVAVAHMVSFGPALRSLGFGTVGVEVFFVISGFIMVHISRDGPQQPALFMAHRIARIVPLYWLLTCAVFVLAMVAPQFLKSTEANPGELLRSLLFIPFEKAPGRVQPLLFQGWTLNFEMLFYVIFAASLWLGRARLRVIVVGATFCLAVAVGLAVQPADPVLGFYLAPVSLCFVAGTMLGLVYPKLGIGSVALTGGILLLAILGAKHSGSVPIASDMVRIGIAVAIVTVALACEARGLRLDWAPLLALGAASYSLYLVHPFVSIAIERASRHLGLLEGRDLGIVAVVTVVAMIAASLATFRWIEQPLNIRARALVDKLGAVWERRKDQARSAD